MTSSQQHTHNDAVPVNRPVRQPYGNGRRVFYGLLWTFYAVVTCVGAFATVSKSVGAFLVLAVACVLCTRYAYRIWTFRARRLLFLIIF